MQLNYITENRNVFVTQVLLLFKNFVPRSWQNGSVGRGKMLSVQTWQAHLDSQYPSKGGRKKKINPTKGSCDLYTYMCVHTHTPLHTMNLNSLAHFGLLKTKPRAFKLGFQTPEYKEMPQSCDSTAIIQGIFPIRQVRIPLSTGYVTES